MLLVSCGGAATEAADASDESVFFNIPAQPLISALDAYSVTTGMEVLYDSALVVNRGSEGVRGRYSKKAALARLLEGSDLVVRSISAGAITIVRRPAGQGTISRSPPGADPHRAYFAMIQTSFETAFCREKGNMDLGRVILRFRIGPFGEIKQPEVLDSPDVDRRQRTIAEMLRNVTLAEPPPADMPQPIIMLIRPSALETIQCSAPN